MSDAEQPVAEAEPVAEQPRPGRVLAQARENSGRTIAEVAQQLKLSPYQIEALEADDYARLPGPVFVRGFVRNYARLLGLDAEPLLSRLEPVQAPTSALNAVPHSQDIPFEGGRGSRWPLLAAVLVLMVALVLLFEWLFPKLPQAPSAELPVPALQPVVPPAMPSAVVPAPVAVVAPAASLPAAPSAVQAAEPAPPTTPTTPTTSITPTTLATPATPPPVPAASGGGAELRMVFERQSWVEVRDRNDRVLFSQLNPAGAVQTVQGTPPLSLVIGNAAGVRLTYKGKVVDLAPHTKTDVARLTLE